MNLYKIIGGYTLQQTMAESMEKPLVNGESKSCCPDGALAHLPEDQNYIPQG
jgi:hypothetical protein